MFAGLLFLLGAELPERPAPPPPPPPRATDCAAAYDVAGDCEATCLPRREVLTLYGVEDYAAHLVVHVRALELEVRALQAELEAERRRATRLEAELARRGPLLERPVVGVVAGVGLCAASGWAIGQAGR